jgi:type II secretory ATPase GspE/PulE/Tfp pilus assembly ATPase PilB-like protein
MEAAQHPWPALGALLLRDGLVDKDELEDVLAQQDDSGHRRISAHRLGKLLVDRGTVTHAQVGQLVAEQYELPFIELAEPDVNLRAAALLSEDMAHRFSALPVSVLPDGSLLVAVSDPPLVLFSDEFRRLLGVPLRYAVAAQDELAAAIAYAGARMHAPAEGADVVDLVAVDQEAEDREDHSPSPGPAELDLVVPDRPPAHRSVALGALLMRDGLMTDDDLDAALAQQRIAGNKRLGEILVERGVVTRTQVARLVAEQYDLPFVELDIERVDAEASALLSEEVARRLSALPVGFSEDGSLLVLVADPTSFVYGDELRLAIEAPIRFAVAAPDEIEAAIAFLHDAAPTTGWSDDDSEPSNTAEPDTHEQDDDEPDTTGQSIAELEADEPPQGEAQPLESTIDEPALDVQPDAEPNLDPVEHSADDLPVDEQLDPELAAATHAPADDVQRDDELLSEVEEAVTVAAILPAAEKAEEPAAADVDGEVLAAVEADEMIRRALSLGASSIHFTPQPHALVVRGRVDGAMRDLGTLPATVRSAVPSHLAERAGLDAGGRAPRVGLLAFADGENTLDLQVATLPTKLGVKVSVRLRDEYGAPQIADLGLEPEAEKALREALRAPCGVALVCGPALSGRTTTLYAALAELATPERTLVTIEDPVERLLAGVDQVEVDPTAGLTFARGLRAVLRTDPDVVLVGELRDEETAQVAFRAARAEHIVLTSLDAPTTASAIERLTQLGVEPLLLASTLSCLVAQGLARRICPECRETYYASAEEIAVLGRPDEESGRRLLARGRGCPACEGKGYQGWVSLFEVLPLTDEIRTLVGEGASPPTIRQAAVATGMRTLRDESVGLCLDGLTTVPEVRQIPVD